MEPQILRLPQILLAGFSFYGDPFRLSGGWTEENEIGRLWSRFMAYLRNHPDRLPPLRDDCVSYEVHIQRPESAERGEYEVFVGMEILRLERLPVELSVKLLPPPAVRCLHPRRAGRLSPAGSRIWWGSGSPARAAGPMRALASNATTGASRASTASKNPRSRSMSPSFPMRPQPRPPMTADLSPVLRSIDCIERRLRGPFRVADAADAAGYSLFHFSRVFSQSVRQSPYEYLMRRRLSQAALDLLESGRRVLDVALDFQFDTPEGFSRAFKRMFGQQPQQFRKQNRLDPRLLMPRLTEDCLRSRPPRCGSAARPSN